jgi:hypothetical protein
MLYVYIFLMQLRWMIQGLCPNHSRDRPAGLSSFYTENYRNLTITTSHKVHLLHFRIYQHLHANCKWVRISKTRVSLIWLSLSQTFLAEAQQFARSDSPLICYRNMKVLTKRWESFARGGGIVHWNQPAKSLLKESQKDFSLHSLLE